MTPVVLMLTLVAATPAPPELEHPGLGHRVAGHTAFFSGLAASAALSFGLALLPPHASFEATGRPEPLALAGGIALGVVTDALLTFLVLPELYRLGGDDVARVDVGAVRGEVWRLARWPALGAAAGALTLGIGAALEHQAYGRGQVAILVGLLGVFISAGVFEVMSAIGGVHGYQLGLAAPSGGSP